jgi:hypothetical protein
MMRLCSRGSAASSLFAAVAAALLIAPPAAAGDGQVKAHGKLSNLEGDLGAVTTLGAGDRFGWSVAEIGDFDGNGVTDLVVGAPWDDDGGTDTGAVYIVTMNADGTVSDTDKITEGTPGFGANLQDFDWFGWSVASLGDLDGDGVTDIAVGASADDQANDDGGAVYVLFLNANGTVKSHTHFTFNQGGFGTFLEAYSYFGSAVANLGDVDGDGVIDLAVGSFGDAQNGPFRGAIYIVFMNSDGSVKGEQKINDSNGAFFAERNDGDEFGWAAAGLGDLDGDGVGDVAVGAILDDDGNADAGTVTILFLNSNGTVKEFNVIGSELGGMVSILDQQDHFGRGVANIGDINGDGVNDLGAGAVWDGDGAFRAGAAWVLLLDSQGVVIGEQKISASAGNFTGDLDENDTFGNSVAPLGDFDGDGTVDMIVGADHDDDGDPDTGALYILYLESTPFTEIGNGLAGTHGEPGLSGVGDFVVGQNVGVALTNALENTLAWFVGSVAFLNFPFKGGVLVPDPAQGFALTLNTGPTGDDAVLAGPWPAGVPAGVPVIFQCWIPDPGAIKGFAASNAVEATTP